MWEPPPRVITIYRRSICRVCDTEAEVAAQVHRTVIHEFGHYFGIGDERLPRAGLVGAGRQPAAGPQVPVAAMPTIGLFRVRLPVEP